MAALGLAMALALGACGSDEGGSGSGSASASGSASGSGTASGTHAGPKPAAEVRLEPTMFEPDEVSIKVGDRVLWKWGSGVQHNVNGGEVFKSKLMSKGEFAHTFDTAGTYEYVCDVHPTTMKGTVEVTDS